MSAISTPRRSARLAARRLDAPPAAPRKQSAGELRADFVRLAREFREAQQRIEVVATAPAAPQIQHPPDAPETQLLLTIRIPVRTFPAASEEEKNKSVSTIRDYLNRFEASAKEQRVLIAVDLYTEMIRQPILVAWSVKFRNQTIRTLNNLAQEVRNLGLHEFYAEAMDDIIHDYNALLDDLPNHPWWTPDPLDG